MAFKKKKNKDVTDLSIVDDYKEPFTWRNFWDEHIVGRIKKIKNFMKENGILYFLLSPFQYKSRLVVKIMLVVFGILIGFVPRTVTLINVAKDRNASSEIANVPISGVASPNIMITPLASGQYKNTHILAFNIMGSTDDGVPSTTSGYDVTLSPLRGVTDAKNVSYRYKVLPVNPTSRLMLLYVDNTKQNDTTGIFGLDVHMKGEKSMPKPMEIVLSTNQKTTDIYKNGKINLSALSTALTSSQTSGEPIKEAEDELANTLDVYKLNEERLAESGITLGMTTDDMKKYVEERTSMPTLTDKSTTKDIDGLTPEIPEMGVMTTTLKYKGKEYKDTVDNSSGITSNDESTESSGEKIDSAQQVVDVELPNVASSVQKIQSALSMLNSARATKYKSLSQVETVLNQVVEPSDMSDVKHVKE